MPEKLELFRLDVKNGHREVRVTARKSGALRLEATRYAADTLWKIEVEESLEPGNTPFPRPMTRRTGRFASG